MFKRILVPLDGSQTAEGVLPVVITEAKLHGASIMLLRVIAPLRQSLMSIPSVMEQVYSQVEHIAGSYLEVVADKIRSEGLVVEIVVDRGRPARRTLAIAQESECDLIIIGTHGETADHQWRFGSVANKVVKAKLPIPVMVVPV